MTVAERFSDAPGFGLFADPLTGTVTFRISPQAEPSRGNSIKTFPVPFTFPFTLALVRALAGSQPSTPLWLMHTPIGIAHEPFGVLSPSKSQVGSQSTHWSVCLFPGVTSLSSMPL